MKQSMIERLIDLAKKLDDINSKISNKFIKKITMRMALKPVEKEFLNEVEQDQYTAKSFIDMGNFIKTAKVLFDYTYEDSAFIKIEVSGYPIIVICDLSYAMNDNENMHTRIISSIADMADEGSLRVYWDIANVDKNKSGTSYSHECETLKSNADGVISARKRILLDGTYWIMKYQFLIEVEHIIDGIKDKYNL